VDEVVTILLSREQWEFVLSCFERDTPVHEMLGDEESMGAGRDVLRAVRAQLP
jgi:hypothetical protein